MELCFELRTALPLAVHRDGPLFEVREGERASGAAARARLGDCEQDGSYVMRGSWSKSLGVLQIGCIAKVVLRLCVHEAFI